MSFAEGRDYVIARAAEQRFAGNAGLLHFAKGAGAGAVIGGGVAAAVPDRDDWKFNVPFFVGAGAGLGIGVAGVLTGVKFPSYDRNVRRGLMDIMARQGVLELPASGSNRYADAITRYLDHAANTFVDPPFAFKRVGSMEYVEESRQQLAQGGPWASNLWNSLSSVETVVEHFEAFDKFDQLRKRVPLDVPQQYRALKSRIDNDIRSASLQTRHRMAYPERALLGRIESQLDVLETMMAGGGG
jgi:hypothetical protein